MLFSTKKIKFSMILIFVVLLSFSFTLLFSHSPENTNFFVNGGYNGNVELIKESLFAIHNKDKMILEFELENHTNSNKEVNLSFWIYAIYSENSQYGSISTKITAKKGRKKYKIEMPTIIGQGYASKSDYVWFNIGYTISDNEDSYSSVKSLYNAMIKYNLQIIASDTWEAGSNVPIRIKLLKAFADEGLEKEKIQVKLTKNDDKSTVIYNKTLKTDKDGEILVNMKSPSSVGTYTLFISTKSSTSKIEESASFTINVNKSRKIYITTDKPMYQPGQDIHIRTLSLGTGKIPIANEDITITVYDGKGNKVFKEEKETNDFGVCASIFTLASFVNVGHYKIEVELADTKVEKTINVERYVLPKFKVSLKTDKEFYAPGETIKGTISGNYFFGKPVSNSELNINLYTFDVEWNLITTLTGYTNESGNYTFNFKVPDYLVGSQFEQGSAFVRLEIILTDNAEHTQGIDKTIPISDSPIVAVVFPETENFGTDMMIKFFVITTDPLGRPMETENIITIENKEFSVKTNDTGLGSFLYKINSLPMVVKVNSKTSKYFSEKEFYFDSGASYRTEHILLRTNKPDYKVGEKISLNIFSSFKTKKIYIDIIKEGKTLLTKSVPLDKKQVNLDIPVSSDMDGILRISAYTILSDSTIVRDTRLVYVDRADEIKIDITPDKEVYLPGEDAKLNILVSDSNGKGKQSAVGFVIVDEAVYALQENKPGLEKIYFEVEESLKQPKYEIHSFSYQSIFMGTSEIDKERAEVFLVAANNDIDFGIEYSSGFKDISRVKSNIQYYIDERNFEIVRKLVDLLYDRSTWTLRDTKTSLKEQILDIIKNDRIIVNDLWKKRFVLGLDGENLSIMSAGMDQSFGTIDDFVLSFPINDIQNTYWNLEWTVWPMEECEEDMNNFAGEGGPPAIRNELDKEKTGANKSETTKNGGGPRVRKYFPETLHVEPSYITDTKGKGSVELTVADSITTWRISSTANTKTGDLGSGVSSLRVFQEFFIDIDFPVSLTQNDQISVPIAIYNYLKTNQTIELKIKKGDWFELLDEPVKKRRLKPNEVTVEYFTIKVKDIGTHAFQVIANGSTMSDAIERRILVKPDGDPVLVSYSDKLEDTVNKLITIPGEAIDKSQQFIVKVYPGLFSQVVEGLDSLFRLPGGCFEQTSSATYPNILALRYMQEAGVISPEIELKASAYINQGYQRLLTFEVSGGGFSWFGDPPAHNILTAYGLMEFYDMSFVHVVDESIITRTQNYLVSTQDKDGSFPPDSGGIPEGAINAFQNNKLRSTGYLCWSLAYSKYNGAAIQKAITYIKKNISLKSDSYTLAILANALLTINSKDRDGQNILKELDGRKKKDGNGYYWEQDVITSTYGSANIAVIETTALIAYAMMNGKSYFSTVEGAINYLIRQKDCFGNWTSTQATVATLRTFIKSIESGSTPSEGTININVNGKKIKKIYITEKNYDVMQQVDISPFLKKGDNEVSISLNAKDASFLYQIAGVYYIPRVGEGIIGTEPVSISVSYDKTTLEVDDMVTVNVSVQNNYPDINLGMMIVDIGIAPGFDVVMDDFSSYLEKGLFSKVEPAGRQLIIYIDEIKALEKIDFKYRMKARFPMKVKSPSATFYSYYGDEEFTVTPPELNVNG